MTTEKLIDELIDIAELDRNPGIREQMIGDVLAKHRFSTFSDQELLVLGLAMDTLAEQVARSEEPHTTLFHEWASEAGKRRNARDLARRRDTEASAKKWREQ